MQNTLAYFVTNLRSDFVRFCDSELQKLGLSQGLLYFLLYIGKHPNCSPGEMSSALGADSGHTTRSVDKLVSAGFTKREKDPKDGRAYVLSLTEQGQRAFLRTYSLFEEWDSAVLTNISKEDRDSLLRILAEVKHIEERHSCV